MWYDVIWCDVMWGWCDVMVQVSMLCHWYLTKLGGEIFLWTKYPCSVNDISRNWLVRYFYGTSIYTMSMISYEISWWDISVVQVSMLCQWYLTKLVGEIFLWYKYPCYVNDISRNKLARYFCGTRIPAMSTISHEIRRWDISVVEMIQVIQVIQLFPDNQVRLVHLWGDFWFFLDM